MPAAPGEGGGNKLAVVIVTIVDDTGAPVEGASVTGRFSGNFTGTSTAPGRADDDRFSPLENETNNSA